MFFPDPEEIKKGIEQMKNTATYLLLEIIEEGINSENAETARKLCRDYGVATQLCQKAFIQELLTNTELRDCIISGEESGLKYVKGVGEYYGLKEKEIEKCIISAVKKIYSKAFENNDIETLEKLEQNYPQIIDNFLEKVREEYPYLSILIGKNEKLSDLARFLSNFRKKS